MTPAENKQTVEAALGLIASTLRSGEPMSLAVEWKVERGRVALRDLVAQADRAAELETALREAKRLTYDATVTYSSFCDKCGPMDDADESDPKYLGTPMMTETLPLRAVIDPALAGDGGGASADTLTDAHCSQCDRAKADAPTEHVVQGEVEQAGWKCVCGWWNWLAGDGGGADELQRERDEAREALDELSPFPRETVFAWKRRVESAEAIIRYAKMLLDPERQDEPDEENTLRAFEALSGVPLSVEAGLPAALRDAEQARREADQLRAALRDAVTLVRIGFLVTVAGERATADFVREPALRELLLTILQAEDTDAALAGVQADSKDSA